MGELYDYLSPESLKGGMRVGSEKVFAILGRK